MTWQVRSEYLIMLNDIILMDLIKIVQKGRHEAYYCAGFKQNGWLNCVPNHVHVAAKNWSLGGFAKITKSDYLFRHVDLSVCLSLHQYSRFFVCPPARNISAPTGRIFMDFGIWLYLKNLSWILKFY